MKKKGFRSAENAKAAVSLLQTDMSMHLTVDEPNSNNRNSGPSELAIEVKTLSDRETSVSSTSLFGFMDQHIAEEEKSKDCR